MKSVLLHHKRDEAAHTRTHTHFNPKAIKLRMVRMKSVLYYVRCGYIKFGNKKQLTLTKVEYSLYKACIYTFHLIIKTMFFFFTFPSLGQSHHISNVSEADTFPLTFQKSNDKNWYVYI